VSGNSALQCEAFDFSVQNSGTDKPFKYFLLVAAALCH